MTTTEAEREVQQHVATLYKSDTDWATFYREVLGVNGIVRQLYRTREALAVFKTTEVYAEIQRILQVLRAKKGAKVDPKDEPTAVLTVRIPRSLHEALREEAYDHRTSMNKLCISKLLRLIDAQQPAGEPALEEGGGVDL